MPPYSRLRGLVMNTLKFKMGLVGLSAFVVSAAALVAADEEIETKTDPASGMVIDENWELVRANCIVCHSTKGFTQIRLDRNNWEKIIRLMQEKNGLWPLGEMEPKILEYLEKNYGLTDEHHNPKIRRPLLD